MEQFFSKTVSIVVTSREPPPLYTSTSTATENTHAETSQEPSKRPIPKPETYKFRSRPQPIESPEKHTKPIDILLRARNLHIKIWTSDSTTPLHPPLTQNSKRFSAHYPIQREHPQQSTPSTSPPRSKPKNEQAEQPKQTRPYQEKNTSTSAVPI